MDVLPIDLTALLAIFMGVSIVLVPVIGITARFALKPTVEALDGSVKRLAEVAEFHRALNSGEKPREPEGGK
jgi:hypothetical protein